MPRPRIGRVHISDWEPARPVVKSDVKTEVKRVQRKRIGIF